MIGEDGRMTADAGERFAGLTVAEAQEAVVAALREQGLIRAEEPYTHSVPFSHRSGERIEPLISLQWFCRMDELAEPAIEVVERDQVRFVPEQWKRVYLDWMDEHPPLVHLAPALVGPPAAGLVLRRLRGDVRRRGEPPERCGALRRRAAPGRGRARHLVQLGPVAVRDPRLARRDARSCGLLPDRLPDHGARHHLPLGRPDGDDGPRVRRRDPVRATSTSTR